jgi:hypothetical protein
LTVVQAPPVYPDKQTFSVSIGTSQRCHKRTHVTEAKRNYTSSVRASSELRLNPLLRKERPHFLQEAGKGGFIFKDEVIAAC